MLIGYAIIRAGLLDGMNWHASAKMEAMLGRLWGPTVDFVSARVPGWALFLVGLGVILVSFSLLDRVLPNVSSGSTISKPRGGSNTPGRCSAWDASSPF